MVQSSPRLGQQMPIAGGSASSTAAAHMASQRISRSLPPPMSDRSELTAVLQRERAQHAEQGAKILAILEVKDGVIDRLERELDASRKKSHDEVLKQKAAALVEERERELERKKQQMQELLEAQRNSDTQEVQRMQQEVELLRRARAQAEADAIQAGQNAQVFHEQVVLAEQHVAVLEKDLAKHREAGSAAIERARILSNEVEEARADARRHALEEQMRPTDDEVVRLERALLQCQRDLAVAERELHSMRSDELERSGAEATEKRLVTILNRELSEARISTHQIERQWHDAESHTQNVEEADRARIGQLELELEQQHSAHRTNRGCQTNSDGLTGWLEESLRHHDAAVSDLVASIRKEARPGLHSNNKVGEHRELHCLRLQVQQCQEEHSREEAKNRTATRQLQKLEEEQRMLVQQHDDALNQLETARLHFAAEESESRRRSAFIEERFASEAEEHLHEAQALELQLRERQEQLRIACRSLDAAANTHATPRLGELTGQVLMLTRSEHALQRKLVQAQAESEHAASSRASSESSLKLAEDKVAELEESNQTLARASQEHSKDHAHLQDECRRVIQELSGSQEQLADVRQAVRKHSETNEAWCQRIVDQHDAHIEQLARERAASEEQRHRLMQELKHPMPMVAAESTLRDLRELLQGATNRRGPRRSNADMLHGASEIFATALDQLIGLERRSVSAEVEVAVLQERLASAADQQAETLRDVTLLQQEVLLHRGQPVRQNLPQQRFLESSNADRSVQTLPEAKPDTADRMLQVAFDEADKRGIENSEDAIPTVMLTVMDRLAQACEDLRLVREGDADRMPQSDTRCTDPGREAQTNDHFETSAMLAELRRIGRLCELLHSESCQQQLSSQEKAHSSAAIASVAARQDSKHQGSATANASFERVDDVPLVRARCSQISRSIGISTDPEVQSSAAQTTPVRVCGMRELPHHEARLEAAAEAQASVIARVETVLSFQRGLQSRYQNVAEEVIELREDRAENAARAKALQEELTACNGEVALAVQTEIGTFEDLCLQRSEREAEAIHIAAFREVETLGAALHQAQAETTAAVQRQILAQDDAKHIKQEAAGQRHRILLEESCLTKARSELHYVEERMTSEAATLSLEQDLTAQASIAEAKHELRDQCEALVLAREAARLAESRTFEASQELCRFGRELVETQEARAQAETEAQTERAEAALVGAEAVSQKTMLEEMANLTKNSRDLTLQLESAEAKLLWAEIARKEDHDNWMEEYQSLRDQNHREARELGARARRQGLEYQAFELQQVSLSEDNESLHHQVRNLTELLDAAHSRFEKLHDEQSMGVSALHRNDRALQRELAAARGREAALLQQMERLRSSILAKKSDATVDFEHSQYDQETGAPAFSVSDGEADCGRRVQQTIARRADRGELKRLQRLLTQERGHREQQRTRAGNAEREAAMLTERLQTTEAQLRMCKEESERRRALVSTLHQRCSTSVANNKEEQEIAREHDEARRSLHAAKRDLRSRDAALHELRQEISEVKQQRAEKRLNEDAHMGRLEADASRGRACRAEMQRKEQLLRHARAQVQKLEMELSAEQHECQARGAKLRRLRSASHQGSVSSRQVGSLVDVEAAERCGPSASARMPQAVAIAAVPSPALCNDGYHKNQESVLSSADVGGQAPSQASSTTDVRWLSSAPAETAASALMSSIEVSTLEESLSILNIRREDIAEFFA